MPHGTALVTGASAGIGRALAEEFARNGYDLVLVARREEKLQEAAEEFEQYGVTAHVVPTDLGSRENREELYEEVTAERGIEVDTLVNNVGIGTQGKYTDIPVDRDLLQIELNITTPSHLTKLFGADMVERGDGRVLNVASSAAFQPGPFMAVYYASKAYLLSFSEALHEELAEDGVTVTALCPGPVATEFQERAENQDAPLGNPEAEGLLSPNWQAADEVARAGYDGVHDGEAVVVTGTDLKVLSRLVPLLPRSTVRKIARRLNEG
jgi:short-subunit dehydrogenase